MGTTYWNDTSAGNARSVLEQIQDLLDDATFETNGDLEDMPLIWANNIQREVANILNIPDLLTSGTITIADGAYSGALPSDFMKAHSRYTKLRYTDTEITRMGLPEMFEIDPNHDDTSSGTYPDNWAIEGTTTCYVYPQNNSGSSWSLTLENYYRVPTDIANDTDIPDLPNDYYRTQLLVAGVVGKYGFPALNEYEQAAFWYNDNPKAEGVFQKLIRQYYTELQENTSNWSNRAIYF